MIEQLTPSVSSAYTPTQGVAHERLERLSPGEQVLTDIYTVSGDCGGFMTVDIDMTEAQAAMQILRSEGVHATYTHFFVWAAAHAMARNPKLHRIGMGKWRVHPVTVDISLMVSTGRIHPATMLITHGAEKSIRDPAIEVITRTPIVRTQADQEFQRFQRLGHWIPSAMLRRWIIAYVQSRLAFRRANGVLAMSCIPHINTFVPLTTTSTGSLGAGQVEDRVVLHQGIPCVRPMVTIACCFDHKVWHGLDPALLLKSIRMLLETPTNL